MAGWTRADTAGPLGPSRSSQIARSFTTLFICRADATSAALTNFNRIVERRDWGSNLARELARADLALKPTEFLAIRAGAMLGLPLLLIILSPLISLFGSPIAWIGGFLLGYWLPKFWLGRRKSKRLKAFSSELSDTIMLLANSLRAGS